MVVDFAYQMFGWAKQAAAEAGLQEAAVRRLEKFLCLKQESDRECRQNQTTQQCRGPESNWGHADFQSAALPTELPRHIIIVVVSNISVKKPILGSFSGQ